MRWKEEFITYLKAIDADRMSAERKRNLFLHCLGSEGQVVYRTLPPVRCGGDYNVYDEAVLRITINPKPSSGGSSNFALKGGYNSKSNFIPSFGSKQIYCYRCGNLDHIASFPRCPAIGKECSRCGQPGHFSKMCKIVLKGISDTNKSNSLSSNVPKGKISCVSCNVQGCDHVPADVESGIVVSIQDFCDDLILPEKICSPKCKVHILGKELELMADSGSPWTIIRRDYCSESLGELVDFNSLHESDIVAHNFDGSNIDFLGFKEVFIEFKGNSANIKLYIAFKGVNVLGWRDQAKLGIVLNPRNKDPVSVLAVTHTCADFTK